MSLVGVVREQIDSVGRGIRLIPTVVCHFFSRPRLIVISLWRTTWMSVGILFTILEMWSFMACAVVAIAQFEWMIWNGKRGRSVY